MIKNIAFFLLFLGFSFSLLSCSDSENDADQKLTLEFAGIPVPASYIDKTNIVVSQQVSVNGNQQPIAYHELMATGQKNNGEIFGLLKNAKGEPLTFPDGSFYICNGTNAGRGSGLDHFSILQRNDKLFMVSQFECAAGAMYMSELAQTEDGELKVKEDTLQYIDQSKEFGGFVHCAGMTTPWQSHLGSEEYEPDARQIEKELSDGNTSNAHFNELAWYWGSMENFSPYFYGWTPEVKISDDNQPEYTKHYAMGRLSHELAYVMPDERTVYMSDDGTNVGLFMFVADKKEDLSAGTLYAAKWKQVDDQGAGKAQLTWISLGHAQSSEIRSYIAKQIKFSDIFETADAESSKCPAGFTSINASAGHECLKLKDINGDEKIDAEDEKIASRLEARRFAAMKGATTEFRKMEGITFNPGTEELYLAMSSIERGMEDSRKKGEVNSKYDEGASNDIRLTYNACGAVYALDVSANHEMGTEFVAYGMRGLVEGKKKSYKGDVLLSANKCDVEGIASPDNLTYLENSNSLIIGEDTSKHENNFVWQYDLEKKTLTRILSAPLDAETTSPFWHKNINGFGYLTIVVQHPMENQEKATSAQKESQAGYLGPFLFQ